MMSLHTMLGKGEPLNGVEVPAIKESRLIDHEQPRLDFAGFRENRSFLDQFASAGKMIHEQISARP